MAAHTASLAASSSGEQRQECPPQEKEYATYRGHGWYMDKDQRWQRICKTRPEWTTYGTGRKQDTYQLSVELNHQLRGHTRESDRLVRNGYFDQHFFIDVDELLAGTSSLRNWDPWVRDWILYIVKRDPTRRPGDMQRYSHKE